jgi:hypothetical protein
MHEFSLAVAIGQYEPMRAARRRRHYNLYICLYLAITTSSGYRSHSCSISFSNGTHLRNRSRLGSTFFSFIRLRPAHFGDGSCRGRIVGVTQHSFTISL